MLHYVILDLNYYLENADNVKIIQDLEHIIPNCSSYNVCMILGTTKNITEYLTKHKLTRYIRYIKEA